MRWLLVLETLMLSSTRPKVRKRERARGGRLWPQLERTRTFLIVRLVTYHEEPSAFWRRAAAKRLARSLKELRNPACWALLYYYLWARYLCDWTALYSIV